MGDFPHGEDGVTCAAWSPDSASLITGTDNSDGPNVYVWDVEAGDLIDQWSRNKIWNVAWSPDGKSLAVGGGLSADLEIWGLKRSAADRRHDDRIRSIAWSPDGRRVASGSEDRTIRVWNVDEAASLAVIDNHWKGIHQIGISDDSNRVYSGGGDGRNLVWDPHTGNVIEKYGFHEGRSFDFRGFTALERLGRKHKRWPASPWRAMDIDREMAIAGGKDRQAVAWLPLATERKLRVFIGDVLVAAVGHRMYFFRVERG